jgi:calcium-dependent protein kinase
MNAKFHFNHKEFEKVSEEGKALIKKMLVVDPSKRITAENALKDSWFIKFKNIERGCDEDRLDSEVLEKLRNYKGVSSLKKVAMNILVKMADSKEIEHLRDMFMKMDKDHTGDITAVELKEALDEAHNKIDDKELE